MVGRYNVCEALKVDNPIQLRAIYATEPGEVAIYRNGNLYHIRRTKGREVAFKAMKPGFYQVYPEPIRITPEAMNFKPVEALPPPDRNQGKKASIRVNRNLSGTPARIFPATGVIEVGETFHTLPEQAKLFILLHELGHFYYTQEKDADHYALYHFNKMGGNPSQSVYTLAMFLTDTPENKARINSLFQKSKHL